MRSSLIGSWVSTGIARSGAVRCGRVAGLVSGVLVLALLSMVGDAQASTRIGRMPAQGWPLAKEQVKGDQLGWAVAISGGIAVVGAPRIHVPHRCGYVDEFRLANSSWRLSKLGNPNCVSGDDYGYAVGITGRNAVVGAPGWHDQGIAYLSVVVPLSKAGHLMASEAGRSAGIPDRGDYYGVSVAVTSSNLAVVGADGAHQGSGKANIYARSDQLWALQSAVTDPAQGAHDKFGAAVAVSGATVVIGAPGSRDGAGAAYVYTRSGTTWRLTSMLTGPSRVAGDDFGDSVAISGATIVVGADGRNHRAGLAYLYQRSGSAWLLRARLADHGRVARAQFGESVAISPSASGIRVLVGAPRWRRCGAAFEFTAAAGAWKQRLQLADPGCVAGDRFGYAVAISGADAVVGAPGTKGGAGQVYGQIVP